MDAKLRLLSLLVCLVLVPAMRLRGNGAEQYSERKAYALGLFGGKKVSPEHVLVFVASWKTHAPDVKVVLFFQSEDEQVISILRDHDVLAIPLKLPESSSWKWYRYEVYGRFLENVPEDSVVFVSDVRDVAVQANPLEHEAVKTLQANQVYFTLEGFPYNYTTRVITSEPRFNLAWAQKCFPNHFEEYKDKPISCSGFTFGGARGMRAYFRAMLDTKAKISSCQNESKGDQIIHTFVLHMLDVPFHKMAMPNTNSVVTHMGIAGKVIPHDAYMNILMQDGRKAFIIHQYDRMPSLRQALLQKYPLVEPGLLCCW